MNRIRRVSRVCSLRATALASCIACLSGVGDAHAQSQPPTAPDAGSLLRESERQAPRPPVLPKVEAPKLLQDTGIKVLVQRFSVEGSSRYPAERLTALLADLVGQELGFAQLQGAADRVATLYRTDGLHATALLPEQTLQDGLVRIVVVEGRYGKLKVEPAGGDARRLPVALLARMLGAGQTRGQMVDTKQLERTTLLANAVPGARVSSTLTAGAEPGETDVVASVDPRPLFSGLGTLDNEDARATGAAKAGITVDLSNPAGWGDQAEFMFNTTEGKQYSRASYDVPLGASGWRGSINSSYMIYRLLNEFAASGGKGRSATFGAETMFPFTRSVEHSFYGRLTYDHRHLVNQSDAGTLSDKTAWSFTASLNGDTSDTFGGGGATIGGVSVTGGRLRLDDNAADLAADAAGPHREGRYAKVAANIGRLQRVSTSGSVWLSVNGQYASKNLDSSEQFSLGGSNGVRAYPTLEASGDAGVLATLEYRHHLNDRLQFSAFYDVGEILRERDQQPGAAQPNHYALKGLGLGVDVTVGQAGLLRAMVATRLGSNPAAGINGKDSDGTHRRPQLWLSASLPF